MCPTCVFSGTMNVYKATNVWSCLKDDPKMWGKCAEKSKKAFKITKWAMLKCEGRRLLCWKKNSCLQSSIVQAQNNLHVLEKSSFTFIIIFSVEFYADFQMTGRITKIKQLLLQSLYRKPIMFCGTRYNKGNKKHYIETHRLKEKNIYFNKMIPVI